MTSTRPAALVENVRLTSVLDGTEPGPWNSVACVHGGSVVVGVVVVGVELPPQAGSIRARAIALQIARNLGVMAQSSSRKERWFVAGRCSHSGTGEEGKDRGSGSLERGHRVCRRNERDPVDLHLPRPSPEAHPQIGAARLGIAVGMADEERAGSRVDPYTRRGIPAAYLDHLDTARAHAGHDT